MKVRITKADGTVIEAEGTPEECARLCETLAPTQPPSYVPPQIQIVPLPYVVPQVTPYIVEPWVPTWTGTAPVFSGNTITVSGPS